MKLNKHLKKMKDSFNRFRNKTKTEEERLASTPTTHATNINKQAKKSGDIKKPSKNINFISEQSSYKLILASKGYIVSKTLGSGSYSKVKLATEINHDNRQVAIKIVNKSKAPLDYQQKFMPRELAVWPHLYSNFLVNLYKYFSEENFVFMVMEYSVNGDTLNHIQQNGPLLETQAAKWFAQAVCAVGYLHSYDIAHRDLKLENLLLDADWNVKVCDFGFVKDYSSTKLSRTYCGSKSYAAPEILQGHPYKPKKVDIWALGVILYIFITAKMPFNETLPTPKILNEQKILGFTYRNLENNLSPPVNKLIKEMFTWDFERRPEIDYLKKDKWIVSGLNNNKAIDFLDMADDANFTT